MAVTWGLVFLMLTISVQNIEFHSNESKGSLPMQVPENISIVSLTPIIYPGTDNSSAHSESQKVDGLRKDAKPVLPRSNELNGGCNASNSDSPYTFLRGCHTSTLIKSAIQNKTYTTKSQTNLSSTNETVMQTTADDGYEPFSLPPVWPLTRGSLKPSNYSLTLNQESVSSGPISCQGRCGDREMHPCSCADICIVHGNCCYDMNKKCPHLVASATSRFKHLKSVGVECSSETSTFVVMSCSDQASSGVKNVIKDPPVFNHGDKTENFDCDDSTQCRASSTWKKLAPFTKNRTDTGTFAPSADDLSVTNPNINDEARPSASALVSLMLNTPVTDITTGIVYRNRSIAQCNRVLDVHIVPWKVQAPVISAVIMPQNLGDVDQIVTTKVVAYMKPDLPTNISTGSECITVSSGQCQKQWIADQPELEMLCRNGNIVYYKTQHPLAQQYFDNIYCLLCNLGSDNHSVPVLQYKPLQKTFKLSVVLSLSNSGKLTLLTQRNSGLLYWDGLACTIHTAKHGDSQCSTTKCASGFVKRPDGVCRIPSKVKFAIGGEKCFFMRSQELENKLLSLIKCYLETAESAEIDTEDVRFDTVYETRMGIPLLQLETTVHYPYFSLVHRRNKINRDLALLVYDANFCCVPLATNITCSGSSCRLGELVMEPITSFKLLKERIKLTKEGIGLVNDGSITICDSKTREHLSSRMYCQKEPIYASEFHFFNWTANISCFGNEVGKQIHRTKQIGVCNSSPSRFINPCWVILLFTGSFLTCEENFHVTHRYSFLTVRWSYL